MRVGLHTLITLKHCGDKEAEKAFKLWVRLSDYNNPPVVVATYSISDGSFETGLIWDETLNEQKRSISI